jgi:potassium-dependent mechanosensitive channel
MNWLGSASPDRPQIAGFFNKAAREAQPLSPSKVNSRFAGAAGWVADAARPWSDAAASLESPTLQLLPAMKLQSGLRVLRWVLLAFALSVFGAATAEDASPLDLEATRAALTAIETALKDKNLTDADLQRLRAENDPLGVSLQAAIADLSPRVAASAKRLAELTPKSQEAAPQATPETNAAAVELANEKQKHDALDGKLRAARAMLLQVDDNATRISAARRELFARETFAVSSSVLNPQLWLSIWRETPADVAVIKTLFRGWLAGLSARLTVAQMLGFGAAAILLALIAAPVRWMARRVIDRDPHAKTPSRLHRALAAAWTVAVLAVLPLLGLWALAATFDAFDILDPRMQGVVDALFDAARLLILVNALGRGVLAPHLAVWRMVAISNRSAAIVFRAALTIAAIWAAERLVEPAADAVASLNIAVAARALGAMLIALVMARGLRRLAAPLAGAAAPPQRDIWAPARTLAWAAALVIFAAALSGHIAFGAFVVNQAIYLSMLGSALYLGDS